MVKLYTIVKDEVDIVKDWIVYHGCMFGWNNIYVIDNYSTDGTYEVLQEFKHLINITRENDYKKKGIYMKNLIEKFSCKDDTLAFPLDIDEFIIYHEKGSKNISVDKILINNYINNLPESFVYKAPYLGPVLTKPEGFNRSTIEVDYAGYNDMGSLAKSFIDTRYFNGVIDHGNHICSNNFLTTNIALVHYHNRNLEQMKKKIYNNVTGLGYNPNIDSLKKTINNNPYCDGNHHVKNLINIHENNYVLPHCINPPIEDLICITPLKECIINGFF